MRILLILLLSVTTVVEARMYQWTESGVETTQLSGKPPAWYRSTRAGPRVFVFDKGRLIDDTAIVVADDVRQRMRQEAFILAEEDRQKAQEKIATARKLKQKYKKAEPEKLDEFDSLDIEDEDDSITDTFFPDEAQDGEQDEDTTSDQKSEELRVMIEEWEKSQTERAKQALE